MRKFQITRYIKKWTPLIIIFFIIATFLSYNVLKGKQSYTASAVIEYTNEGAEEGLAPDETEIDVSEISSSSTISKVLKNLGYNSGQRNLDALSVGVGITPIVSEQSENIQEAVNKEGEEYEEHPTSYIITFSGSSEDYVRNILNELLDVYLEEYSHNHINQDSINNQISSLANSDYDYIEIIELIDSGIGETAQNLYARYDLDPTFRSSKTGYTFEDLYSRFELLQSYYITDLYARVLGGRISKNTEILINKYNDRIAALNIDKGKSQEDIQNVENVIGEYVDKMRTSDNSDINYQYIIEDVEEDGSRHGADGDFYHPDRTVQYDSLMRQWVAAHNQYDTDIIQAAYYQYIIDAFKTGSVRLANGKFEDNKLNPTTGNYSKVTDTPEDIDKDISHLIAQLDELYSVVDNTNEEFNEYLGAKNIKILSTVSVAAAFDMKQYMIVIAFFFLIVGCLGAILAGRFGDILEAVYLIERKTGCKNRPAYDKFIKKKENSVLTDKQIAIILNVLNLRELNEEWTKDKVDDLLAEFAQILKDNFEKKKNSFISHNGGGQFSIFYEDEGASSSAVINRLSGYIATNLPVYGTTIHYELGAASSNKEIYYIQDLITEAENSLNEYTVGEKK